MRFLDKLFGKKQTEETDKPLGIPLYIPSDQTEHSQPTSTEQLHPALIEQVKPAPDKQAHGEQTQPAAEKLIQTLPSEPTPYVQRTEPPQHYDIPQLEMTFQEAQKAGFQFSYRRSRKGGKTVVITSIHVKSSKIIIPAKIDGYEVKAIADDCNGIINADITEAELYLPNTLTHIGINAFRERVYCGYKSNWSPILTAVYFSSDSTHIGETAFAAQKNIKELHFGKNTHIGKLAFTGCKALEKVELGICSVENMAFYGCENLRNAAWQAISIQDAARIFYNTPYEKAHNMLIIDKTLQKYNGNEEAVIIPDGVEDICQSAFYGSSELKKVHLPKTLKTIGAFAFNNCVSLKEINLEYVKEICNGAFEGCIELGENITLNENAVFYNNPFRRTRLAEKNRTSDGILINGILVEAKENYVDNIWRLSDNVRRITDEHGTYDHFYKNKDKTVIIPSSVEAVYGLGLFIGAKRIIIENPQMEIGEHTDIIMANHVADNFVLCVKTETGISEFPFYYPEWKGRYNETQNSSLLYYRFFRCRNLNIYEYDDKILTVGLTYRQMLDIAYKRLIGGFMLHEKNRERYMEFVCTHRKKGLKYATEENDPEKMEFFKQLFIQ